MWPRKGSLMKTQTRILVNRLYYIRKIELHRKGKESRTVRITPILICSICWPPHLTGKCDTRPFFPKMPTVPSAFLLLGAPQAPGDEPNPPKGVKAWGVMQEIARYWDTLGQIRAADNTAGRSATRHLERCRPILIRLSGSEISQY